MKIASGNAGVPFLHTLKGK